MKARISPSGKLMFLRNYMKYGQAMKYREPNMFNSWADMSLHLLLLKGSYDIIQDQYVVRRWGHDCPSKNSTPLISMFRGRQSDQIGRFLKVLGNKFAHKSTPKRLLTFGLLWKRSIKVKLLFKIGVRFWKSAEYVNGSLRPSKDCPSQILKSQQRWSAIQNE